MSRLREAFASALSLRGQELDVGSVDLASDMAQLLVRSKGLELQSSERDVIDGALQARTRLPESARELLLEMACSPQHSTEIGAEEVAAFAGRFGPESTAILERARADELSLGDFAERYGAEDSLLLLDAMFRVGAADGQITADEARLLEQAAQDLGVDAVLVSALFQRYDPRHAAGEISWPLEGERISIGRAAGNDVVLSDPQVAKHHCTLLRTGNQWRLMDAGSGRPTLVGGQPITTRPVTDGEEFRVGPWALRLAGETLHGFGHRSFTALGVRDLNRHIESGGERITLLEDVSFSVFSGELVALVGPSGAGKTTLINAIAGIAPADTGQVLLGAQDFHEILQKDSSAVGLVPQDDLVHPELTVEESLRYSGRLRYASHIADEEIDVEVERVLGELGIEHIRGSRIGDALKRGISGGQRKRVNLGQDLLTRSTRVLFLDEPTSGLDPRSAQSIVRQIRQLADDGRIVFLVTHDLTPSIMALVDHLLVMVPGGRLAYFGPPEQACTFFDVASPDQIFDRLDDHTPVEWAQRFKESPDYRSFVATRTHLLAQPQAVPTQETELTERAGRWQQFKTLSARYARTKLRDRAGLAVLAVQPPILALLIWIVFPVPTTRLIFMLSLSCLWFGMSMSVRELIIDRTIWRRERKVGVRVLPYLSSKLVVLAALNAVQTVAFTTIVYFSMGLGDYGYGLLELSGAQALTGLSGLALGLMLSALYTSSEAAVGMLPLLLIPNICFSSIMVSLRDMGPLPKAFTWITMQRYAFDLSLKVGTHLEGPSRIPGKWDRKPLSGPLYDLGLKGADVEDFGLTVAELAGSLGSFVVLFLAIALVATWARDRN